MVTNKIKELEATREKLARLEKSVETELRQELASLPKDYGFDSLADFVKALKAASSGRRGRRSAASRPAGKKRRHRAVITDATRATVKKLVEAGKTGEEIAKEVGISLPSVQNVKKALGLVKARK